MLRSLLHLLLSEIEVGYELPAYTAREGDGRVDLTIIVSSHRNRGTPRPFTLSVTTRDDTAGMLLTI